MPMHEYADDPSILNEEALWRRIPPGWVVWDHNRGTARPSSQAFRDDSDGSPMSVFLAAVMQEIGRGPYDAIAGHTGYALAWMTAGLARRCEQGVARDPLPDEPAHGVVFGKKTRSARKTFAREAAWVIPPPDTS